MADGITRIDDVLMAISIDPEDNTEGVCAVFMPEIGWMPLIAADKKREPFVRAEARKLARDTGMLIKLIRLTAREEVETVTAAETETVSPQTK